MNATQNKLLQSLQQFNHIKNIPQRYKIISAWLIKNGYANLNDEMTAPGYANYQAARQWFTDYYINDQNEGVAMAKKIDRQIKAADPNCVYLTDPDYRYGYDYTPTEFKPVSDHELIESLNQLIYKIKDPNYQMYTD